MKDFHGSFLSMSRILPSRGSEGGPGGKRLFAGLPLLLFHQPKDAMPRARRDAIARPENPVSRPTAVEDGNVGEEATFYAVNSLDAQSRYQISGRLNQLNRELNYITFFWTSVIIMYHGNWQV